MIKITLSAFADEASSVLDGQIKALKRNGIKTVELRNVDGMSVKDLSEEKASAVYEELKKQGIAVWSVGSPLGKTDINVDFEEYKKDVIKVMKIANNLHTDKVRVFSFFNAYDKGDLVVEYLNQMVDIAAEYGITLYHENEKDIFGDTKKRVKYLMEKVKGLKFIYDPANFLQTGEKAENTLPLSSVCSYYHIKDVITETGALVPAGDGDGKIRELIRTVDKDTTFTVEPHLFVFEGYSSIDKTEMKNKYIYTDSNTAVDTAVKAIKTLLKEEGYIENNGEYIK